MTGLEITPETVVTLFIFTALAGVIALLIGLVHGKRKYSPKRKRPYSYEPPKKDRDYTEDVNREIGVLNSEFRVTLNKAAAFGDEVTQERIMDLIDEVQKTLDSTHDYNEVMRMINYAQKHATEIYADMMDHERDLESFRRQQAARQAEERAAHPFGDTVYFKSCKTEEDVKRTFHRLAKVYHPDNPGGSAEEFAALQDEYKRVVALTREA